MMIIKEDNSALSTIARISNEQGIGRARPNPEPEMTPTKRVPAPIRYPQPKAMHEIIEAYNKAYHEGSTTESESSDY